MDEILRLAEINKLKEVYRATSVEGRKESSAEHTWSAMVLADFFIEKFNLKLDKLKVYELLLYHDMCEIKSGDVKWFPGKDHSKKEETERKAIEELKQILPEPTSSKMAKLHEEFESKETIEARFVKAIDRLDPVIQVMSIKEDWAGYSKEEILGELKKSFEEFPELWEVLQNVLNHVEEKGFFES